MCTHRTHIVFHGKVTIRCTGTILGMLFQIFHHQLLHVKRETSACTKLGERHLVCIRQVHLIGQFVQYRLLVWNAIQELIFYFRNNGQ